MSEEVFYHYTDAESAQDIFLSGKICPSLFSQGNAVHGDGVYLTTLEPRLGREVIANNNWGGLITGQNINQIDKYMSINQLVAASATIKKEGRKTNYLTKTELLFSATRPRRTVKPSITRKQSGCVEETTRI